MPQMWTRAGIAVDDGCTMRHLRIVFVIALAACGSDDGPASEWKPGEGGADAGAPAEAGAEAEAGVGGSAAGGNAGQGGAAAGGSAGQAGAGPKPLPVFDSLKLRCKLISDRNLDDPTANNTHHRANLRGTDLGIPVSHGPDVFFFFGDTAGAQGIWPLGVESLPDAVGYSAVPYAQVAEDPSLLCGNLRFLLTGGKTGTVEGDFAGASMQAPPGHDLSEFIRNPAGPHGQNLFPQLPGDFEVPSGAFSHNGSIYVFYTIVNVNPLEMRGSYLAKWDNPSTGGKPDYRILHHVDQRFDASGPMRGDFINIAPVAWGEHVYLFGTGQYRASPVHLARKALAALETEGGYERYDATSGTWGAADAPSAPVVATPNLGELSVRYFPSVGRWVMLDQEVNIGNRIAARFAETPQGPWSEAVTVATMEDPAFAAKYCCLNGDCLGDRLFNCGKAGFYGTYMLPDLVQEANGAFSITFTISTWDPYNVALMTASFHTSP